MGKYVHTWKPAKSAKFHRGKDDKDGDGDGGDNGRHENHDVAIVPLTRGTARVGSKRYVHIDYIQEI